MAAQTAGKTKPNRKNLKTKAEQAQLHTESNTNGAPNHPNIGKP